MKTFWCLIVLSITGTTVALADSNASFYAGASVVSGDLHNAYEGATQRPTISVNTKSTGFKVFGGYTFNRYVGVELGYVDGLTARYDENDPNITLTSHSKSNVSATNISVLGQLPLGPRTSLFAKTGYAYWKTNDKFAGTFQSQSISGAVNNHEGDFSYGIGIRTQVRGHVELRGEYEIVKMREGVELRMLSAGGGWHF